MERYMRGILSIAAMFMLMNCSSSDPEPEPEVPEPTVEELQMQKLAKTWELGTVSYGTEDVSDRFSGFTLVITKEKKYTVGGNIGDYDYEPFKASGSWTFKDGNLNILSRNDGVDMAIQVTDNSLDLTFTITPENGRVQGLGAYHFELKVK